MWRDRLGPPSRPLRASCVTLQAVETEKRAEAVKEKEVEAEAEAEAQAEAEVEAEAEAGGRGARHGVTLPPVSTRWSRAPATRVPTPILTIHAPHHPMPEAEAEQEAEAEAGAKADKSSSGGKPASKQQPDKEPAAPANQQPDKEPAAAKQPAPAKDAPAPSADEDGDYAETNDEAPAPTKPGSKEGTRRLLRSALLWPEARGVARPRARRLAFP